MDLDASALENTAPCVLVKTIMWLLSFFIIAATPAKDFTSLREGPIDFRCDKMDMRQHDEAVVCSQNVVLRRDDLLLCCDLFRGWVDVHGQWTRWQCNGGVRGRRGSDDMWAQTATWVIANHELVFTGQPSIHRNGLQYIKGKRIIVDTQTKRARIDQPKGTMIQSPKNQPPTRPITTGALPATCPLRTHPPQ